MPNAGRQRRGTLLIAVLACLTLVILLAAAWMKGIALERQQVRAQQNAMQAEYLARSALGRAAARLALDADYAGEMWKVGAEALAGRGEAVVAIQVDADRDDPRARVIRATAQFGTSVQARAQRSKQLKINLPTQEQTP